MLTGYELRVASIKKKNSIEPETRNLQLGNFNQPIFEGVFLWKIRICPIRSA